jgi:hypothetical protein
VHVARRQLDELRRVMRFADLQQLSCIHYLQDGTAIKCTSIYGQGVIEILTPRYLEKLLKKDREEDELTDSYIVVVLSSGTFTYGITGVFSRTKCLLDNKITKLALPAIYFNETYLEPYYDLRVETCPCVFTLDHSRFIVVYNGENIFQTVANSSRDDWHNNRFKQDKMIPLDGSRWLEYNEAINPRQLGITKYAYSFSPYTCNEEGVERICRYIDHAKRLYIPVLGRGKEFEKAFPLLANSESFPYGKKPFTILKSGIDTHHEVVRIKTLLTYPDADYTMQLFWPFIAYMHEIPYLNLQYLTLSEGRLPLKASLLELNTLSSWRLQSTKDGAVDSIDIRSDNATGTFPPVAGEQSLRNDFAGLNVDHEDPSGTYDFVATQTQERNFTLRKSASIGTVGNKIDLFVETDLKGKYVYNYNYHNNLVRSSDFYAIFYSDEFVDDGFWGCGVHNDSTASGINHTISWLTTITGTQELKVGDVVIDSGDITLSYDGKDITEIFHGGWIHWELACPPPVPPCVSIGYTSQQMQVSQQQTLTALDISGDLCTADGCTWAIAVGAGTLNTVTGNTVVYTAPADNAYCNKNPIITLTCDGQVIDSLAIAINWTSMTGNAGIKNYGGCETYIDQGVANGCSGVPYANPGNCGADCLHVFKCNGTLYSSGWRVGAWGNTPPACDTYCATYEIGPLPAVDYRDDTYKANGCCPEQLL